MKAKSDSGIKMSEGCLIYLQTLPDLSLQKDPFSAKNQTL